VDTVSGIGVLDKAVSVLDAVEARPLTLAGLVEATGLSRATAHRLAVARLTPVASTRPARLSGPASTASSSDIALSSTPIPLTVSTWRDYHLKIWDRHPPAP